MVKEIAQRSRLRKEKVRLKLTYEERRDTKSFHLTRVDLFVKLSMLTVSIDEREANVGTASWDEQVIRCGGRSDCLSVRPHLSRRFLSHVCLFELFVFLAGGDVSGLSS